jgi:oligopeptide transport system substrate-binding protein
MKPRNQGGLKMKKLLVLLMALLVLVGCTSGKQDDSSADEYKDTFNYVYTADLSTFDYIYNNKSTNGDIYNNGVEGLLTQDKYGVLSPGMAESWEQNDDATVWTFHLRQGAQWVTNNGEVYDEVKAEDFVTGLRHAAEFKSLTLWLVGDVISNLNSYVNGEVEWDAVGIKAVDDYTVEYTLSGPTPYFPSMTTYSILFPVNKEFLESKGEGCKLGSPNAEACSFGALEATGILYNSAYVISNYTSKSVIELTKNENYWDAENVFIKNVKLIYTAENDDPDYLYKMFKNGEVDATSVRVANPEIKADAEENYGDNMYITDTGTTCYWVALNVNRSIYNSPTDPSKAVSPKANDTVAQESAKTALLNVNFRRAIMAAFSSHAYEAVSLGEELADGPIRNTIVAPTFCRIDGAPYVDVLTEKMQAIEGYEDVNLEDGQDAWYNVEKAKAWLEKAKEELGDSVTYPIQLDTLCIETSETSTNRALAEKAAIEDALGSENVQINIISCDSDTFYDCWYYVEMGSETNADLLFFGGWGPDYEDPRTYLNIFLPENGDMIQNLGLNVASVSTDEIEAIKEQVGLTTYGEMCAEADAITDDNDTRFTKYAEAEAYLLSQALVRPMSTSGAGVQISKIVPYTAVYGNYGWASYNIVPMFKGMKVYNEKIQTAEEHETAKAAWMKGE